MSARAVRGLAPQSFLRRGALGPNVRKIDIFLSDSIDTGDGVNRLRVRPRRRRKSWLSDYRPDE